MKNTSNTIGLGLLATAGAYLIVRTAGVRDRTAQIAASLFAGAGVAAAYQHFSIKPVNPPRRILPITWNDIPQELTNRGLNPGEDSQHIDSFTLHHRGCTGLEGLSTEQLLARNLGVHDFEQLQELTVKKRDLVFKRFGHRPIVIQNGDTHRLYIGQGVDGYWLVDPTVDNDRNAIAIRPRDDVIEEGTRLYAKLTEYETLVLQQLLQEYPVEDAVHLKDFKFINSVGEVPTGAQLAARYLGVEDLKRSDEIEEVCNRGIERTLDSWKGNTRLILEDRGATSEKERYWIVVGYSQDLLGECLVWVSNPKMRNSFDVKSISVMGLGQYLHFRKGE